MAARDPRVNPYPGDECQDGRYTRRVIERTGDMLLIDSGSARYWMTVDLWQRWCEEAGAVRLSAKVSTRVELLSFMGTAALHCVEESQDAD